MGSLPTPPSTSSSIPTSSPTPTSSPPQRRPNWTPPLQGERCPRSLPRNRRGTTWRGSGGPGIGNFHDDDIQDDGDHDADDDDEDEDDDGDGIDVND